MGLLIIFIMNLLDWIIISIMLVFLIRGIFRGFFREIFSLAGIILGIYMANLYQPHMTACLKGYFPSGKFLPLISFGAIFIIVFILFNLTGWLIKMLTAKTPIGCLDRWLGAGLAFLKGIVLIYLIIIVLTFFIPSKTPLIAKSRLTPLIIQSYQSMVNLISPGFYQELKRKFTGETDKIEKLVSKKVRNLTGKDGSR